MPGLLHLAAAVGRPDDPYDTDALVAAVRLAERGGLDFVTFGDPDAPAGPGLLAALPRVAAATERTGLVVALPPGPAGVPDAVAELDRAGRGRGGWWSDGTPRPERDAADAAPPVSRPVHVVRAAGPRDPAVLCADVILVRAAGLTQAAALRTGVRALAAESGRDPEGLRVLAELIVDLDGEYAAEPGHGGGGPRPTPRGPLYRGGPVDLADLIASWHAEHVVDGFHLTPADPRRDLERLVNGTVALLQHRALFRTFYPGGTLRDHLGLARSRALT
ncbi:FMNH2-dependent monooxygenase [Streptomyces sp. XM83C]|jgi:alkanesulfonate monooxygenase SsuD/methylene tetrahydromethanopterin reductase-like flavin-dependent oxidoreductase (luciferase family)|uniref:FMNH2-dependent monooxygenase n=1 Tax=Streptomyces thermocoprophilus TaxID=78356 RepID=A0ABV5VH66_9ACTN|nr:FMNH2-dependent monooxygenase [Streptomyces sp. XM83C]MCK1820320.1 FMNH2-dependent monooxygenase [Streptomyces sp. XM83C]